MSNWKKELDKHFPDYFDDAYYEKEDTNLGDELKAFITTEIIEKLIEEAGEMHGKLDDYEFKQQLKAKWGNY